jgi:hypothetical protein|tara:strand:+ start:2901 stop:3503 length:603 start_codon:yes stop_codon:yes gene_type:complete
MSYIRTRKVVKVANLIPHKDSPNFFMEMAPAMIPTHAFDQTYWNVQMDAISQMQNKYSDLNRLYPLQIENSHGNRKYSQTQAFSHICDVEHMVECMHRYNLTMRLNIKRPSEHAATHTCMELSKDHLVRLIGENDSENSNVKTIQLRAKADAEKAMPTNGDLFFTIRTENGKHFFQHVDYEISEHCDDILLNNADTTMKF